MNAEDQNKNILSNLGIDSLNEMQIAARQAIIKEQNVLLLSPTGSGKTLAFLLPILQLLDEDITKVQCLIVVPSRELALQTEQVWKKMGTKFKVNVCYGGHSIDTELKNLSSPPRQSERQHWEASKRVYSNRDTRIQWHPIESNWL